jgi:hypothetical protein
MDIYRLAEVILQRAGYRTRFTPSAEGNVLGFEDEIVIGFLHVFPSANALAAEWQAVQKADLMRHGLQLRAAPNKAWNVYCVFLTENVGSDDLSEQIDRIEEDFVSTRKIARAGVVSPIDLERVLLPLLPLKTVAGFSVTDYDARLRPRLGFLQPSLAQAILRGDEPAEIARQAIEGS